MPKAYDCIVQVMRERFEAIDANTPAKAHDAGDCPEALLAHLAWCRGLDYWSAAWTDEQKRALIRATPANLRRRGAAAAIDAALEAFETEVEIEEWWEQSPEGTPGTARATIAGGSSVETDPAALEAIARLIRRESRRSIHWTVDVSLTGSVEVGADARARVTSLHQFSGVQTGA